MCNRCDRFAKGIFASSFCRDWTYTWRRPAAELSPPLPHVPIRSFTICQLPRPGCGNWSRAECSSAMVRPQQGLAYTHFNAGPIRIRAEIPGVTRKRAFLNHALFPDSPLWGEVGRRPGHRPGDPGLRRVPPRRRAGSRRVVTAVGEGARRWCSARSAYPLPVSWKAQIGGRRSFSAPRWPRA
jgi:hypothetical protein